MKTILVPVDFSPASENAARYAWQLAKAIRADILLCHAIILPLAPQPAARANSPDRANQSLEYEADRLLSALAENLPDKEDDLTFPPSFKPTITWTKAIGSVTDVISKIVVAYRPVFVVMGMSGVGGIKRAVFGSSSRAMMDKEVFPVLLIPATALYHEIHTIAFATELSSNDIDVIYALAGLAASLNAELLLLNLISEKYEEPVHERIYNTFAESITSKIDYPKLAIKHLRDIDIAHGLEWLVEHGHVEMVAMVHHKPGFFERIFETSDTQKFARHTTLPLLVFPQIFNIAD